MDRILFPVLLISLCMATTAGRSQSIDEINVTAKRLPNSPSSDVYSSVFLGDADLDGAAIGLDDALRRVPGFGLFRRQASRAAHPTTQGVSLRGLGPNGAGRTLVLLDGIPLNDPFGGWVEWVHLPTSIIGQATIVRGGGSGTWGNSALAGVVRLDSRSLQDKTVSADIRYGNKNSVSGSGSFKTETETGTFSGSAHIFESDGFYLIGDTQRGAADRRAGRGNEGLRLAWTVATGSGTTWTLAANASSDTFVNGSNLAGAETDTYGVSLSAVNRDSGSSPTWETHLYAQRKEFENVFAAFDGTRSTVRPVLDQFDVPVIGLGANVLMRWSHIESWTIEGGADIRFSDGETNERFRNLGAGFTRAREAGGEQLIVGSFLEGTKSLSPSTLVTFGARVDYWDQRNGIRKESNLENSSVLVDRHFADRNGISVNGRAGFRSDITDFLDVRASIYSGFRVPTLNELYRPFRVGNDITEANETLVNERMVGAEASLVWEYRRVSAQATIFRNDLFDPVLNTTITTAPGFNSKFGVFIPNGGSLRQRRNVDRVETWGVELDAAVQVTDWFEISGGYLFSDPKISSSSIAPSLEGNRLAQVAKHQASLGVSVQPNERLHVSADVFLSSAQFEDDLNSRVLGHAVTMNLYIGYDLTESVEVYASAENLFDERVEAGRTASGLITLGPPVFLWVGIRLNY